jgi:predicted ATPase/DNA-binding winged helix-turn-helix (wHTH) protein
MGGADLPASASSEAAPLTEPEAELGTELWFADFRLLPAQRRLEREGAPVRIGGRAFDLLTILASRPGEVIDKAELLNRLWHGRIAEESSLRFHIAALRKTLGDKDLIANIAGRGYSFVAPVSRRRVEAKRASGHKVTFLPALPRRLVGRDEILGGLPLQLRERRFVTIVGPGGIGKTSIALAAGHQFGAAFNGDVCFFDVANESDSRSLVDGLALALGISVEAATAAQGLAPLLRDRRLLLILDGCEAAIDAAATLAEELVQQVSGLHVLATSREALRVQGEYICRLPPLPYPNGDAALSVSELLGFPSVQLFVERAVASDQSFEVTSDNAALVGAICRKLDGLALAIEIAAGRVEAYGVAEIERQLESQFALRWPGRRTAVSRHQTLSATLDWSYALLSPAERAALRRLAVFPGNFTLEMAASTIQDAEVSAGDAHELVTSLVVKSLVQPNLVARYGTYHLLDTTRSYASEKLAESGESLRLAERHARLVLQLLEVGPEAASADQSGLARGDLLANLRAALKFTLTASADHELAAALAWAARPIWTQNGLLTECIRWTELALKVIDPTVLGLRRQLDMQLALAGCMTGTQGLSPALFESWSKTLLTVDTPEDMPGELTRFFVVWGHTIRLPDYPEALSLSLQADRVARQLGAPGALAMVDWMVGVSHHHIGMFAASRERLERSMAGDVPEARHAMLARTGYQWRHSNMGVLSNVLWAQGLPDRALQLSTDGLSEARSSSLPLLIIDALSWHTLTVYLRGDNPAEVDTLSHEIAALAGAHGIEGYVGFGLALGGLNRMAQGDLSAADAVSEGLRLLARAIYGVFHPYFKTECARFQAQAGAGVWEGQLEMLLRPEENPEHWAAAEVRRNLGEILLHHGRPAEAKSLFTAAIEQARRQGSLAWELRATISLLRSEPEGRERERARHMLRALRGQFSGGEGTADLRIADRLIAEVRV